MRAPARGWRSLWVTCLPVEANEIVICSAQLLALLMGNRLPCVKQACSRLMPDQFFSSNSCSHDVSLHQGLHDKQRLIRKDHTVSRFTAYTRGEALGLLLRPLLLPRLSDCGGQKSRSCERPLNMASACSAWCPQKPVWLLAGFGNGQVTATTEIHN